MKIGVPKEIKPQETRIGLTPESVKTLISEGHEVLVENNGGFEAGFDNDQYTKAGAKIVKTAGDIFNDADIIVKVKEPQKVEVDMLKENQILYTYLHLAAAKELTAGLIKSKSVNIAYETVTDDNGRLPLLAPMSAVAGRMSVQAGAKIAKTASDIFSDADIIVKVKEPQKVEVDMLKENQILYTYLPVSYTHLTLPTKA